MDRQMDAWIDEQCISNGWMMDGWVDGWMDGQMDAWIDEQCISNDGQMDGQID